MLIRTVASLISVGTERSVTATARQPLIKRAMDRPDQVRQVLAKVRSDGVLKTIDAVRSKLGTELPMGYSSAGVVIAVGRDITDISVGDRVACAGAGYAAHAEVAYVPRTLVAPVPEGVGMEEAAFSAVGSVGLQAVRVAEPTLGEKFVVIGLGLIGLLTVQLLRTSGCHVWGVDTSADRISLGITLGMDGGSSPDDAPGAIHSWTGGRGADGVIIAASTPSSQPIAAAGEFARVRGRVVVVGAVGLDVPRDNYYRKEIQLTVSMSYGPGRYDPDYEERARDYPFGYVRWTEGRNLEAFLGALQKKQLTVEPLITERFAIEEAERAYTLIASPDGAKTLGAVITYPEAAAQQTRIAVRKPATVRSGVLRLGMIGAGNYAQAVLLPLIRDLEGVERWVVATSGGLSARNAARNFGFHQATSSVDDVLDDPEVDVVVIATRHDSHAELASRALAARKHVYLEKPLAINEVQLQSVMNAARSSSALLGLGFNRRFSPLVRAAAEFLRGRTPIAINCRVNAGLVPASHWVHDPLVGGGRVIGEACHFVDLLSFLAGSDPVRVYAEPASGGGVANGGDDTCAIMLRHENGALGTISYFANGDKALPKERIEIFAGGATFIIDDFRSGIALESGRERRIQARQQDKGHRDALKAFIAAVRDGAAPPIDYDSLAATTRATFAAVASMRTGENVPLAGESPVGNELTHHG